MLRICLRSVSSVGQPLRMVVCQAKRLSGMPTFNDLRLMLTSAQCSRGS